MQSAFWLDTFGLYTNDLNEIIKIVIYAKKENFPRRNFVNEGSVTIFSALLYYYNWKGGDE